jgi:hypothetical protein
VPSFTKMHNELVYCLYILLSLVHFVSPVRSTVLVSNIHKLHIINLGYLTDISKRLFQIRFSIAYCAI